MRGIDDRYRGVIRSIAGSLNCERVGMGSDDVEQELWIALWQFLERRPEVPSDSNYHGLVAAHLRNRAKDLSRYGLQTGMPAQKRGTVDPIRRGDLEEFDPVEHDHANPTETPFSGRSMRAICALREEHREIVWDRFCEGLSWPQVASRHNRSANSVKLVWLRQIRPALLEEMAA